MKTVQQKLLEASGDVMVASENLTLRLFRSIHDVDEQLWDSINDETDVYHSHQFIAAIEDARVESADFWYLIFQRDNQLVATAALSAFPVNLDMFAGGAVEKYAGKMRQRFLRFLQIRILFCGLPISLGQRNLVIADPADAGAVLKRLTRVMENIRKVEGIRYSAIKEVREEERSRYDILNSCGYFRANSIPYAELPLRWPDFPGYLAEMRYPYRRTVRAAFKKIGRSHSAFEADDAGRHAVQIAVGGTELCPPETFFALYQQVMARAEVKLEMLNVDFFQQLYHTCREDITLLTLRLADDILAVALLLESGSILNFALVGIDYARRDEHGSYFNLVQAIIEYGIENEFEVLKLGQTSYWLKQRLGADCIQEYFYLKAGNGLVHRLLRGMRGVLFPEVVLAEPRVFKALDT